MDGWKCCKICRLWIQILMLQGMARYPCIWVSKLGDCCRSQKRTGIIITVCYFFILSSKFRVIVKVKLLLFKILLCHPSLSLIHLQLLKIQMYFLSCIVLKYLNFLEFDLGVSAPDRLTLINQRILTFDLMLYFQKVENASVGLWIQGSRRSVPCMRHDRYRGLEPYKEAFKEQILCCILLCQFINKLNIIYKSS